MKRYSVSFVMGLFCIFSQGQSIPEMINVRGGTFQMGSFSDNIERWDEMPRHWVTVSDFCISSTEITNAQYEEYSPEHRAVRGRNAGISSEDDDAVVYVNYYDAVGYCEWLSKKSGRTFRLPTEAEWEYACRAGCDASFCYGDTLPRTVLKNQQIVRNFRYVSLKVGQTPPNAYGIYDMHGNVEEWCLDWYGLYENVSQVNPLGPQNGEYRVTRGGSHSTLVEFLRSSCRMAMLPDDCHSQTGFRIVEGALPVNAGFCNSKPEKKEKISQKSRKWKYIDKPVFSEPVPYIISPDSASRYPIYSHNHQPAICWCQNGDVLVSWFSAVAENGRTMIELQSRLSSKTHEWSKSKLFFRVPGRNITGLSLMNDDGVLRHINGVEASGDWQNLMMVQRISRDNGKTWSTPAIIEKDHEKRHQVIAGPIRTNDGRLIQLCDAGPDGDAGTSIHMSHDGGITWHDLWDGKPVQIFREGETGSTIAGIHAGIVELKDGSLLALGRGNAIGGHMPKSLSRDGGRTWQYSASDFPPIGSGQRPVLMRLREGPILLLSFAGQSSMPLDRGRGMQFDKTDGTSFTGYGLFAALSYDEGKTWTRRKLITDGMDRILNGGAWTQSFKMDGIHAEPKGYLAATQTPDGIIHLVSSRIYYSFNLRWLEQLP